MLNSTDDETDEDVARLCTYAGTTNSTLLRQKCLSFVEDHFYHMFHTKVAQNGDPDQLDEAFETMDVLPPASRATVVRPSQWKNTVPWRFI